MKKFFTLLFLVIIAANFAFSQTFTFSRISPRIVIGDTSSYEPTVTKGVYKNTSATVQGFKLVRVLNQLPSGWSSQMCVGALCMSPDVDTIPPFPIPPLPLNPGSTDTLAIDVYGNTVGTGKIIMKCFIASNPNNFLVDTFFVQLVVPSSVTPISEIANDYELSQNYPNPFNPKTVISFSIPKSQNVSLNVYDALGNEVASLINNTRLSGGKYRVDLDISRYNLSSGLYFYRLTTEGFSASKKMIVIK